MSYDIGKIVGAIFVLMLFSYLLYKRTVLFNIAEASLVGTAAGYSLIMGTKAIRDNAIYPLQAGDLYMLIPIILGVVMWTRLYKGTAYLSRIPTAIIIGVGLGLSIRRVVTANLATQIQVMISGLKFGSTFEIFNSLILLIGFITAMSYFVFTKEQSGSFGKLALVGRYILMATFGVTFGASAMYRLSIIAGQIRNILMAFQLL